MSDPLMEYEIQVEVIRDLDPSEADAQWVILAAYADAAIAHLKAENRRLEKFIDWCWAHDRVPNYGAKEEYDAEQEVQP